MLSYKTVNNICKSTLEDRKRLYQYMISIANVNEKVQKEEEKRYINKTSNEQAIYSPDVLRVIFGTICERQVLLLINSYGLRPKINNNKTDGNWINYTDTSSMKVFDVTINSRRNHKVYGFDIKHCTIWKADSNDNNLYLTNTGITRNKCTEIITLFRENLMNKERLTNDALSQGSYLLLICYELFDEEGVSHRNGKTEETRFYEYYHSIFHKFPLSLLDACFVCDLNQLCKTVKYEDGTTNRIFDIKSPYVIDLSKTNVLNAEKYYMTKDGDRRFAIKVNSPACMRLEDFILTELK